MICNKEKDQDLHMDIYSILFIAIAMSLDSDLVCLLNFSVALATKICPFYIALRSKGRAVWCTTKEHKILGVDFE